MFLFPGGATLVGDYATDGVLFDGTNDYLTNTGYSGGSDQAANWLICFWIKIDASDSSQFDIHYGTGSAFQLTRIASDYIQISTYGPGASGNRNRIKSSTTALQASDGWTWVGICCDGTVSGNSMFFDNTDVTNNVHQSTSSEDQTLAGYIAVNDYDTTTKMEGNIADFYINFDEYLDLTTESNRRLFIDASNKPVDLGANGETPTGTTPKVFLHLDKGEAAANFATNAGSGGNFSITGTLTTSSSSPTD